VELQISEWISESNNIFFELYYGDLVVRIWL
jgi:hypothetical protein